MTERRSFMAAVAALASTRWRNSGTDLEELDWQDLHEGDTVTGEFEPQMFGIGCHVMGGDFDIMDDMTDDRSLRVLYDSSGVIFDFQAEGDHVETNGYTALSPEDARNLGAAFYQAAIELEHIRGQDYNPEAWEDDG